MSYELAQLNIAEAKSGDANSPAMASFWAETGRINALADADPGLVWRLQDEESGNAATFRLPGQERMIVNLSVWRDLPALHAFVYSTAHAAIMARAGEWFESPRAATMALWWVPAGHRPGLEECWQRLSLLRAAGPTDQAFTFKARFDAPDVK